MPRNDANPGKSNATEERRQQAFQLRKAGVSYRGIGKQLGVSEAQAHRDVKIVLQRIRKQTDEEAEDLVQMEVARLDVAMTAIAAQVQQGHLGAIDRWIRLSESRRKLLGLDAPELLKLIGNMTNDELNALADGRATGISEARAMAANGHRQE